MNEIMKIGNQEITVKEYKGQRVVTFKDIDLCHERPEGTARKRFNDNKKRFVEGEDYFVRNSDEAAKEYGVIAPNGLKLITQQGYTMLTKTLTDNLAWAVQRELVNNYFNPQANVSNLSPQLQALINIELRQNQQQQELNVVKSDIQDMRDIIVLNPTAWKEDCRKIIAKIAREWGGNEYIKDVNAEIYKLVNERAGSSIETRQTNRRRRMAEEGVCKSTRDKLTKVDIIAEDKKLIEIYIAIVKEMAIKYGVSLKDIA